MKISQHFENHLEEKRWHQDLLEKMLLDIPGIRPPVLNEETYRLLLELLRFRHFNRYYFELDYDWRKIDLLVAMFREALPLVRRDLDSFMSLVQAALKEDDQYTL